MDTKFDPKIHQRKSIRLKGYDYSQAGGYYVTIVSYGREPLFGNVVAGAMQLNTLGKIVQDEWLRSARIRKEIRLFEDEFVVMPNHLHGIVWLVGADGVRPKDFHPNDFHPDGSLPPEGRFSLEGSRPYDDTGANNKGAYHAPLQRNAKSLGSFIAGFKASVTSRVGRELNLGNIWQRNYFEHILRDQTDYERIAEYILNNPVNWDQDDENPQNPSGKRIAPARDRIKQQGH